MLLGGTETLQSDESLPATPDSLQHVADPHLLPTGRRGAPPLLLLHRHQSQSLLFVPKLHGRGRQRAVTASRGAAVQMTWELLCWSRSPVPDKSVSSKSPWRFQATTRMSVYLYVHNAIKSVTPSQKEPFSHPPTIAASRSSMKWLIKPGWQLPRVPGDVYAPVVGSEPPHTTLMSVLLTHSPVGSRSPLIPQSPLTDPH